MKISLKIFVFTYCIMMLVTVIGGFVLIETSYRNDISQARETALDNNKVLYTYVATLEELPDSTYTEYSLAGLISRMSESGREKILVGSHEEWKEQIMLPDYEDIPEGEIVLNSIDKGKERIFQVTSRCGERYIINYYDITDILKQRDANYELYRKIILLASIIIAVILYLFSWYITRPLVKVTAMAEEIAGGNYSVRVDSRYGKMKSYEVWKLGETLNHLAGNTEDYILQLKEEAEKKEAFLGNFTHEIKTPLTSIIGYSDLLRTYELTPDKRREYGSFIYNEGKRLEQLALNLLQLIVMGKTEFERKETSTLEIFERLKEAVHFLGEKYHVKIAYQPEKSMVRVENSMILTALINLVDNGCKASGSGSRVLVKGEIKGEEYGFLVEDSGCGIPEEEIGRIMEPFYMVDKSRARRQGGAGLGLALCQKIAELHDGRIEIQSTMGEGTVVKLWIPVKETVKEDAQEVEQEDEKT